MLSLNLIKDRLTNINPNIEILSDVYVGVFDKLQCKCLICNNIFEICWHDLSSHRGCNVCSHNKRLTLDIIKDRLSRISPNITILSDYYKNNKTKLECYCKICGHTWYSKWENLCVGKGCIKCSGIDKLTLSDIILRLSLINPKLIILSEEYINARTPLLIKCLVCNQTWNATWLDLYKNKQCPKCKEDFNYWIDANGLDISNSLDILEDTYHNSTSEIKCRCKVCNEIFITNWNNIQSGRGCPHCNKSLGEKEVAKFLADNYIPFNIQYRFDDCRNKYSLPFDFYLPDYNCCIEYDGLWHFEIPRYSKNESQMLKSFLSTKTNDNIKNKYCEQHNIKLIRIPYWDFHNIGDILFTKLELEKRI